MWGQFLLPNLVSKPAISHSFSGLFLFLETSLFMLLSLNSLLYVFQITPGRELARETFPKTRGRLLSAKIGIILQSPMVPISGCMGKETTAHMYGGIIVSH